MGPTTPPPIRMTKLRNILRGIIGTLLALFLTAALLLQLPVFQRSLGGWIAGLLAEKIGVPVRVGSVQLGLNGRIVVTDLSANDREGKPLLRANRVAARLNVWPLLKGRVRIGNAQLIGLEVNLRQERADTAANFQFIIDAFSKQSDEPAHYDVRLGQVVLRRAHVTWHQLWKPETPGRLNTAHIDLSRLNATVQVDVLRPDSLSLDIRRLDACEQSGLCISKFKARLTSDFRTTHVGGFLLEMPRTRVIIPQAELVTDSTRRVERLSLSLDGALSTADLVPLYPPLADYPLGATLGIGAEMTGDTLVLHHFTLREDEDRLSLTAEARAVRLWPAPDSAEAQLTLNKLYLNPTLLRPFVNHPLLYKVGDVTASGTAGWHRGQAEARLDIQTALGPINVDGRREANGRLDVKAATEGLLYTPAEADSIRIPLRRLQATATLSGDPATQMDVTLSMPLAATERTELRNVQARAFIDRPAKVYDVKADVDDPNLQLTADVHFAPAAHTLRAEADIRRFAPNALGTTEKRPGESFSGRLHADLHGPSWQMAEGIIELIRPAHTTPDGTYRPGNLHITSVFPDHDRRRITLVSPWLEAQLNTRALTPERLITEVRNRLATHLPTIISHKPVPAADTAPQADFQLRLFDATPLNRLLGTPLQLDRPLQAFLCLDADSLGIRLDAPDLTVAGQHLQATDLRLHADADNLTNRLSLQRLTRGAPVDIALNTVSRPDGSLLHSLRWDNNTHPAIAGSLNVVSHVAKGPDGRPGLQARVLPSTFTLAASLWHIHPSQLSLHSGRLSIDSLSIAGARHSIRVHGTASQSPADTLYAQIRNLDVVPIFNFVNFHSVDFTGEATGYITATRLFSQPKAEGWISFPELALNGASMGHADIYMNWGHRPKSIYLDAVLTDMSTSHTTLAAGYITPAKTVPHHGIDLDIHAGRTNIGFISKYTAGIFSHIAGRASGHARLFGPFKTMQLEGDLKVEEAELGVPFTGVTYRIPADSIRLRPGRISFRDLAIYDPQGHPGMPGHRATVNGDLTYTAFSQMHYNVDIHASNILGYNFPTQGGMSFWGQVWADGDVNINGEPGRVDIDIKARPLRPTQFTYNLSSPDYMMENRFVHYDSRVELPDTQYVASADTPDAPTPEETSTTNLRIRFDLDVTPQARLNLMMDAKSGDRISVEGDGRIRASYYNKGGFEMFGTYRIARGNYGLTLQNIIRKDFRLQSGSTVTFAGNPSATQLNVTATHTVTGVSLNDLSSRATFSNSSARVNCIMNVTGQATQPHLDFDLDILNVNDDEKQMIRSLISTEEERNMQVIYLLGIGRFYTFDYRNTDQSQSTTAMNSLLSSTLSGQLNQMFQSIIGQRNWNVGANLSTGETGWSDLDIEGSVQGSLLDNRLLINGNFGYRDTPANIKQNNFIGDFDIQYHLTPSGNVSLKAYSKTNDRYFTKSTLTTQGVGIRLGKDFKDLRDLFSTRRRKSNKSRQKSGKPNKSNSSDL